MSSIFVHMNAPEDSAGTLTQNNPALAIRMSVANRRLNKGMDASCDILGGTSNNRRQAMQQLADLYDADCDLIHRGRFAAHADMRLQDLAKFRANPLMDALVEQRTWADRFFIEYEGGAAFLRLDLPQRMPVGDQTRMLQMLQGIARISDSRATAFLRNQQPDGMVRPLGCKPRPIGLVPLP